MIELFVSHSTHDDEIVTKMHSRLEVAGISAWVDHLNGIEPGDNWSQEIHQAANKAICGLFILSRYSINSEYCEAEWNKILSAKKKLFVATIDNITLEEFPLRLNTIQNVDLSRNFEKELDKLVKSIKGHLDTYSQTSTQDKVQTVLPSPIVNELQDMDDTNVTPENPLLIGVLIDLSRSMINILDKMPQKSGISRQKFSDALNLLVEKAIFYCRTPEAEEILPRFALFTYGFGFGRIREAMVNVLAKIGLQSENSLSSNVPNTTVRDLFAEIAQKEDLPRTPNASVLHKRWSYYRRSVEAQIVDTGMGESVLEQGLRAVSDRFKLELQNYHKNNSLLLIISDGQLQGASEQQLNETITSLHSLGIQVLCCYLGHGDITTHKKLYSHAIEGWSDEAKRLFRCASTITKRNHVAASIIDMAYEKGWEIPDGAKMFIQVNNSQMIEEIVDILISPLKTN